jgi:hypothetical protein
MKKPNIFLVTSVLALNACSVFYFGHTKEEWNRLTEAEKSAVKVEYQQAINSREEEKHTDIINSRTQSVIDYGAGKTGPLKK